MISEELHDLSVTLSENPGHAVLIAPYLAELAARVRQMENFAAPVRVVPTKLPPDVVNLTMWRAAR